MEVQQHMAVVLVPIMLSTWIRNLKYLVPVSSIANFLIMSGYIATMYIMSHDVPSIRERRYVADWNNLPLFFGTVIYSFEGITLVSILRHLDGRHRCRWAFHPSDLRPTPNRRVRMDFSAVLEIAKLLKLRTKLRL